ncbi:MAG: 2Fe-2S iron-sulfur cluster-binding protein [Gallionellaceae bacterium]
MFNLSSLTLALWIASGILFQLSIFLGVVYMRHWSRYRKLPSDKLSVEPAQASCVNTMSASTWPGLRTFSVERKVIEDPAQSICSFYLVPADGKPLPPFQPGQFLTFSLNLLPANDAGGSITRCYSLSDAPHPEHYRISIKRVPAPIGSNFLPGRSSNYFHDHIEAGSLLQVRAPSGHFYIDRSDEPVVLICGGIGITPILSMLNECLNKQPEREIWLFYGVRNSRELIMKSHLNALALKHRNLHLWICASNPLPEEKIGIDHQHQGRVDINLLRTQLPLKPYHYYICGPAPMLESIVPALENWGVPDARIHYEAFGPSSIKRAAPIVTDDIHGRAAAEEVTVMFSQSGKQFQWQPTDKNLLEFAESNSITVNSGCRAGSCGSCQTKIHSGEVRYAHPPDFDPDEGMCLLCVSIPKSSVVLEL